MYFIKIDALCGYWQCPLDEDSQLLTTFITQYGHYKFKRAPFGICAISEHYNRRQDEAVARIPCVRRIVDDFVAYNATFDEHVSHVRQILERCQCKGISLKREKFQFGHSETEICGYVISPDLIKAVQEFPRPATITDLRSFLGLANQLADFSEDIVRTTEPLRTLLKPSNAFRWEDCRDTAFKNTKKVLLTTPVVAYYYPRHATSLHVVASRLHGLGFVLKQRQEGNSWRMVCAGSRYLSETESRYTMIEIEMLGITWAIGKCCVFLEGLPHFEIVTNHRPLITESSESGYRS